MTNTFDRAEEQGDEAEAQRLRHKLVDTLQESGWIQDPRVADAVASVPRHRFVPHAPLEAAYGHETVSVKDDVDGASLSCASVPAIVAMMLQQADLGPGQRALELGAGSGYNAALLAHLTAPGGRVATIDVDPDLAAHARSHLHGAGYDEVEVLCADGAQGHAAGAPFDRIIATVSPFDVPEAWLDQLAPEGRLVVPVRLAGDASRSIAFVRSGDHWCGVEVDMCTFMPLRESTAADPRGSLDITGDKGVVVQVNPDQHVPAAAVDGILAEARTEVWTAVEFGRYESFGDLWLWLALSLENSLSRMPVTSEAVESGLVEPLLGWGSMATTAPTGARGLAYMTLHKEGERHQLGVIGHGPEGPALAERMAREIERWNEHYRDGEVAIDLYPRPQAPPQPGPGRFVLARSSAHLVITWT